MLARKATKILVIGTGGLGSPCALYLAAAGIGTIGLVDFDTIDETNLHRQILYTDKDVGKSKVRTAKERLVSVNPNVTIKTHEEKLTSQNALEIFKDYDAIVDGTDNFPTRYLTNDASVMLGIANGKVSTLKRLSILSYRELKKRYGNTPSCYKLCAISKASGIMVDA